MKRKLLRGYLMLAGVVALGSLAIIGLSGCGAEPQKPLPPAAVGSVPGGGSAADYKAGMEAAQRKARAH